MSDIFVQSLFSVAYPSWTLRANHGLFFVVFCLELSYNQFVTDLDAFCLKENIFDGGKIGHKKCGKFLKKHLRFNAIKIAQRNERLW
jgi:hypothetical protein